MNPPRFYKQVIIFILLFATAISCRAQDVLTLDKAIETGLKNNYSIAVSKEKADSMKNNFFPGNAGMLPEVLLGASYEYGNNNTILNYSTGQDINRPNVNTNTENPFVLLNWTVFDGFKMFATYDRLRQIAQLGETNFKEALETNIYQIATTYYNIIQQKQLMRSTQDAENISEEEVKIADEKFKIGSGSKLDLLQAEVDLNAQKTLYFSQKILLEDQKNQLNQLLGRAGEIDFDVTDSIDINTKLNLDDLKNLAMQQNFELQAAKQASLIAADKIKEAKGLLCPNVSLNLGYGYTRTANQVGLVLLNQTLGFSTGFTASWIGFDGGIVKHGIAATQISSEEFNIHYNDIINQVESNVQRSYKTYMTNLQMLQLQEENIKLAKENVDVALEKFKVGASSEIEMRTAQLSYEDAMSNLVQARYNAKISELDLLRLNGHIIRKTKSTISKNQKYSFRAQR